jgi:transposase
MTDTTRTGVAAVEAVEVIGGVDTHLDTHTVAAVDQLGRLLGHAQFPATIAGYRRLLGWLQDFGVVAAVGVEGTGSYGAGLARFLGSVRVEVVEIDRPNRRTRRRRGKSDPLDAEAAARAVLAKTATETPKARTGPVEAIRVLRVARRGAIKARTAASNTLRQLVVTAPESLRAQLTGLTTDQLIDAASRLRRTTQRAASADQLADPTQATRLALRRLAQRCQQLTAEITAADTDLDTLLNQTAPALLERCGVGPTVAGQLLVTAGDNPHRLHTDASFAALCGAAPIPASSGRTDRHRLNRGGDRAANSALYTIAIVRMRYHQPTRDYVTRRTAQGLTKKEIIRCLKRAIARELLPLIRQALTPTNPHPAAS